MYNISNSMYVSVRAVGPYYFGHSRYDFLFPRIEVAILVHRGTWQEFETNKICNLTSLRKVNLSGMSQTPGMPSFAYTRVTF